MGIHPQTVPSLDEPSPASAEGVVLTEAGYLILLSLSGGPAHGYRIMQVINDIFRGDSRMGPGTLYRTLQRLAGDRLIEEIDAKGEEDGGDAERRRAYQLTGLGLDAARGEMRRLEVLVRLGKAQLQTVR
jgi:DNA-binding PadR family transcriptional regulator